MESYVIRKELDELNDILAEASGMDEDEFQEEFSTDETQEEYIKRLKVEIKECRERLDNALYEESFEPSYDMLDPAFSSWEQVNSMFI